MVRLAYKHNNKYMIENSVNSNLEPIDHLENSEEMQIIEHIYS